MYRNSDSLDSDLARRMRALAVPLGVGAFAEASSGPPRGRMVREFCGPELSDEYPTGNCYYCVH